MKRIILIFSIIPLLCFNGCKGFLDEDNRSKNTADKYYAKADGYNTLINYAYSFLREMYGANPPRLFCSGTDLYLINYGSDPRSEGIANYTNLIATNVDVQAFYNRCYAAIGAANTALYYAERTEDTGDILKRQIAEARFLRAHFYFLLVQHFGDVALLTEMTKSPAMEVPRDPAQTVYQFIIDELTALLDSSLPAGGVVTTGNDGHIDKRIVRYYLALVHLTRGYEPFAASDDFSKAKTYAVAAIANQSFTLNYDQTYQAKNKGYRNNEIIFSIPYSLASAPAVSGSSGNWKMALFCGSFGGTGENHKSVDKNNTYTGTLFSHYVFSKDIQDPNNDVRHELTFMRVIYNSYLDYYSKTDAVLQQTPIKRLYVPWWLSNDMNAWVANWRTEGTPAQARASTIVRVYPNPGNPDTDLANFQWWSGTSDASTPSDPDRYGWSARSSQIYNFPLCRKFDDPAPPEFSNTCSRRDIDLVRLSDLYFVAAEASIKLNSGDAYTFINAIRERSIASTDTKRSITASQATIDFLLDEKTRESYGDFNRWQDLKRTGKLIERTAKYNPDVFFSANSFKGPDGNNKILRPIPQNAIDVNRAQIAQNPGY